MQDEEEEVEYLNDEDVDLSEDEEDLEDLADATAHGASPAATAKRKSGEKSNGRAPLGPSGRSRKWLSAYSAAIFARLAQ